MSVTIDFPPDTLRLIEEEATAANISLEDFIKKAANNAAYTAKLDRADEQLRQGKVVYKTMEELEAMAL